MTLQPAQLLNHVIRGEGQPIILIHGLFGGLENLNIIARALESEFQVISIDVRNHGDSFHSNSMRYEDMATDVFALIKHLGLERYYLLGHSMGGKIAMQCALTKPDSVIKLVIADIAPVAYQHHHQEIINGLLSIELAAINNRQDADKQLAKYVEETAIRQFLLKNLKKNALGFQWRANIVNIANDYSEVVKGYQGNGVYSGPTMFIKGANSHYITNDHKQRIGELFPHSKAKIIQGAGHWLHAEKSVAFNKIVKDFLCR